VGNYRQECTAIKSAAQEDFDAIVKGLIRVAGASLHHLNDQRCTALHLAAKNGHIGVVRILLWAGANPNVETTDDQGIFPLYPTSKNERFPFGLAAQLAVPLINLSKRWWVDSNQVTNTNS